MGGHFFARLAPGKGGVVEFGEIHTHPRPKHVFAFAVILLSLSFIIAYLCGLDLPGCRMLLIRLPWATVGVL